MKKMESTTFIPIYMEREDFKKLIQDYVKEAVEELIDKDAMYQRFREAWGGTGPDVPISSNVESSRDVNNVKTREEKRAERIERKKHEEKLLEALPELGEISSLIDDFLGSPFYRKLYELIKVHGSMREVSRQTGIPVSTISEAMKKMKGRVLSFQIKRNPVNKDL